MRDRILRPQIVTVRPLVERPGDVFGDAPIIMPDNRDGSFSMRMQLTHTSGIRAEPGDPGRDRNVAMVGVLRKRDIPPDAPTGWVPKTNDVVELVGGDKLFVSDVQPAFPRRISIGSPRGGWDGYRIRLVDRQPTTSAADQYE